MFEEIHLLREWTGAVPLEVPLYPLWGSLVRFLHNCGMEAVSAATSLSVIAYFLNTILIFFTIYRFAALGVKRAESSAAFDEANYQGLEYLVAGIGAVAYLLTPGFVAAAFKPTPLLFSQIFPAAALLVLSTVRDSKGPTAFVTRTFFVGVFMGAAILSGPIGIFPLPLVMIGLVIPFLKRRDLISMSLAFTVVGIGFSLGLSSALFASPLQDLFRVIGVTAHSIPSGFWYPGSIVFAVIGVLSTAIAIVFIGTGRIRPVHMRIAFFVFWATSAAFLGIGTLAWFLRASGDPVDKFVDGIIEELGTRNIIISDGLFDDLLAMKLPENVIIVKLGYDEKVPEKLLKLIPDDEVRFSADLGSFAFVTDWLKKDVSASSRALLVTTRQFETAIPEAFEPKGWCWVGAKLNSARDLTHAKELWQKRWMEVASRLKGRDKTSWSMRRIFAVQGIELAARFEKLGDKASAEEVRGYVARNIDESYSLEAVYRRRTNRDKILASVRNLGELDSLEGTERSVRILELEDTLLPELERSVSSMDSWLVHVLKGELALHKGDDYHVEARDEYRIATLDEYSDLKLTAPKLLLLDASLKDDDSLESDSREVLRRDRSNRMALAILGNSYARSGDNERAETYLRRATTEGDGPVLIEALNDLAEVLARRDKLDEALEISDRVSATGAKTWTFLETRAAILIKLDHLDEAEGLLKEAAKLAREAKQYDSARNILDIDQARLMKRRGELGRDYRLLIRSIRSRNLSEDHRRLLEEL